MMTCPNTNDPNWKALVEIIGEEQAYIEYYKYGDIPSPDLYFGLKKEINIKPGVQELFESNSELAAIGTQEQYSQYLDTIFPESKIEEIDNSLYISVLEDLKSNKIIEKQCS